MYALLRLLTPLLSPAVTDDTPNHLLIRRLYYPHNCNNIILYNSTLKRINHIICKQYCILQYYTIQLYYQHFSPQMCFKIHFREEKKTYNIHVPIPLKINQLQESFLNIIYPYKILLVKYSHSYLSVRKIIN